MSTTAPAEPPRLADLLCTRHRRIALDRWPVFEQPLRLFDTCPACGRARDHLCPTLELKVLPDIEPWQFESLSAFHEAAHTVAAVAAGHPVDHVGINRHSTVITTGPAGGTSLAPWSAPVIEHLVVLWAGQCAAQRRLDELDLGTEANLVDLSWQGTPDLAEIASWTASYSLFPETGLFTAVLFNARNWAAISDLAATLSREYELSGERAQQIVAAHQPELALPPLQHP